MRKKIKRQIKSWLISRTRQRKQRWVSVRKIWSSRLKNLKQRSKISLMAKNLLSLNSKRSRMQMSKKRKS